MRWRQAGEVVLPATDGVVTLRPFVLGDRQAVLDGRDDESERWLGPGSAEPSPSACIEVSGDIVGWLDADLTATWLQSGEANIGYTVFPAHRGHGYAARAVRLLAAELAERDLRTALLVIDVQNRVSIGVARAAGAKVLANRSLPEFPTSIIYAVEFGDDAMR
jgi:predicted acetyltransferase